MFDSCKQHHKQLGAVLFSADMSFQSLADRVFFFLYSVRPRTALKTGTFPVSVSDGASVNHPPSSVTMIDVAGGTLQGLFSHVRWREVEAVLSMVVVWSCVGDTPEAALVLFTVTS